MSVEYCIISIGTLSHNRLWGEGAPVRTPHATTTLVRDEGRSILVDPSLPAQALAARYNERTGGQLADVTDVFCTTLRPVHRRSIAAFDEAVWWAGEAEIETYRSHLTGLLDSAERIDADDANAIEADLALLGRFRAAPESFTRQVHFYPMLGASPGSAGLLLNPATSTIVIAGDAAVSTAHVQAGQIWKGCADTEGAMASLTDLLELADVIVPGHDNVMFTPGRWL